MKTSKKAPAGGTSTDKGWAGKNSAKCAALQIPAFEYITFSEVLQ